MQSYISVSTPPIQNENITATSSLATTGTSDNVMGTMTLTPIAGTYLAIFTSVIQQANAGQSVTISFYINGVQDATSVADFAPFAGGTLTSGSASCCAVIHGVYTVPGGQAIAVQWHVSGGTATVFQRKFTLVKIG